LPESFNVLMKELQALGLDIELLDEGRVTELTARRKLARYGTGAEVVDAES